MPLKKGRSRKTIEENIHEMILSGHPTQQAVAAALRTAYGPPKKRRKSRRR